MRRSLILGICGLLAGLLYKSNILGIRKVKFRKQATNQAENHDADVDVNSEDRSSGEASESPIPQSKCEVLPSHSGAEEDPVEPLCEDVLDLQLRADIERPCEKTGPDVCAEEDPAEPLCEDVLDLQLRAHTERPCEKAGPDFRKQATNQAENHEADLDVNSEDRASDEVSESSLAQCKHTIFLSHSGFQKNFVEQLCEDLEDRHRFPFFDLRSSSLEKGERFPELILEAAKQCQMAVVVVSEEYFESRWPMIELNAFVQARLGSNSRMKILPLFFGLTVSEARKPSRQERWFKLWQSWAEDEERMKVDDLKKALRVLLSFNGIELKKGMRVSPYCRDVVSSICKSISPDIKWDDSHIQGRSNLLKVICEKIQGIQLSGKYKVCVIGIYGLGGIGKTTMCKTLCNELSWEFEGKLCHVELAKNQSLKEMLKEVIKKLTSTSQELLQELGDEGECWHILRKSISWKQKTFLAIDNVWDDSKSIEQAKMFLQAAFHEGSVVMVTSRLVKTLTALGIDEVNCLEMPELEKVDARNLLLYHALGENQLPHNKDDHAIEACVERCYFQKSEKQGYHYLPLALKALGLQLGCLGNNPSDWMKDLPKVREFNHLTGKNPVFSIIRVNFDRLLIQEQALFMDIALYTPERVGDLDEDMIEWLSLVHRQKLEDIENQLQHLKEKGLLEDVHIMSQKFSMHDLYREFAGMEAQGKLNSESFNSRRWVYENAYPTDLEATPSGRCWENLIRVGIDQDPVLDRIDVADDDSDDSSVIGTDDDINHLFDTDDDSDALSVDGADDDCDDLPVDEVQSDDSDDLSVDGADDDSAIRSLNGIQWTYCSNVVVLKLVGLTRVKGVLNLKDFRCLRSLEIWGLEDLDRLEGLEDLNNLTYLKWKGYYDEGLSRRTHLEQFPASLKVLQVGGWLHLRRDVFARCIKLCKLKLDEIVAEHGFDFSNCTSLQSVELLDVQELQSLSGSAEGLTSCLQSLKISSCKDLSDVSGLDHLVRLQQLHLFENGALKKLPNLKKLTRLQDLEIARMPISKVLGLESLRQLRKLRFSRLGLTELPNLRGMKQLHDLNLSWLRRLTTLKGLGDLPSLRHLILRGCESLLRLPDLSKSTNLKQLMIAESAIELQEEDIHMLAGLPLLQPVNIDGAGMKRRLDPVKRKVVTYPSKYSEEREERDLTTPPIKVIDSDYEYVSESSVHSEDSVSDWSE